MQSMSYFLLILDILIVLAKFIIKYKWFNVNLIIKKNTHLINSLYYKPIIEILIVIVN